MTRFKVGVSLCAEVAEAARAAIGLNPCIPSIGGKLLEPRVEVVINNARNHLK